jgi:hypothetical protein
MGSQAVIDNGLLGCAVVERFKDDPSGVPVTLKYVVVGLGGLQRDGSLFALLGWLDCCVEGQR